MLGQFSNSLPMIYDSICGQHLIRFRNPNLIIIITVHKASNNSSLLKPIFYTSNTCIFNTQVHQLGSNLRPHPNNRNCQRSSKPSPHIDNIYHLQNEQLKRKTSLIWNARLILRGFRYNSLCQTVIRKNSVS